MCVGRKQQPNAKSGHISKRKQKTNRYTFASVSFPLEKLAIDPASPPARSIQLLGHVKGTLAGKYTGCPK
jgi:hypothetical protein